MMYRKMMTPWRSGLHRVVSAGALGGLLLATIVSDAPAAHAATNGSVAYVTTGTSSVVTFNTGSDAVTGSFTLGSQSCAAVFNATGTVAYVSDATDNTVSQIDPATNGVVGVPIAVGTSPGEMAFDPAGPYLMVVNVASGNVSVINTSTNAVVNTISVGVSPEGVAFSPSGAEAYVANSASGSVSVINTSDVSAANWVNSGTAIQTGGAPRNIVFSASGNVAYVSLYSQTIAVISTSTNTVSKDIYNVPYADGLALSASGGLLYAVEHASSGGVAVISTSSNNKLTTIISSSFVAPSYIAVDGSTAYVTDPGASAVDVIDLSTETVSGTVSDPNADFTSAGTSMIAINPSVAVAAPSAPTSVVATSVKQGVSLTWQDGSDGGASISDHLVSVYVLRNGRKFASSPLQLVETIDTASATTSYTVTPLSGRQYAFSVQAVNSVGASAASGLSNQAKG